MNAAPLVSIVIPAHNEEKGLARMLDSLLSQTYGALQMILVDDGSTDQTLAIAKRYAEKDPRLTVLSQTCSGVSAARNRALPLCTGKYIRFADADDTLPPDSVALLVRRAEAAGADLVISGYTTIVGDLSRHKDLANREDTVSACQLLAVLNRQSNSYFYGVLWNKLFLRDLIGDLRFDESLFWGEDFSFVMSYLKKADMIAFMKEPVYEYRRTPHSTTFRQVLDSVRHPMKNIRIKFRLYRVLKDLYVSRGQYQAFRKTLWIYLFRFGLDL